MLCLFCYLMISNQNHLKSNILYSCVIFKASLNNYRFYSFFIKYIQTSYKKQWFCKWIMSFNKHNTNNHFLFQFVCVSCSEMIEKDKCFRFRWFLRFGSDSGGAEARDCESLTNLQKQNKQEKLFLLVSFLNNWPKQ